MADWKSEDSNLCDSWSAKYLCGQPLVEMQNYCLCVAGPNLTEPEFSYDTVVSVEAGFSPMIPIVPRTSTKNDHMTKQIAAKPSTGSEGTKAAHSLHRASSSIHNEAGGRKGTHAAAHSHPFKKRKSIHGTTYLERGTYDGGTHHPSTETRDGVFQKDLFRMLGTDFSRLRMQRSVFMMYQLIASSVSFVYINDFDFVWTTIKYVYRRSEGPKVVHSQSYVYVFTV